jgi:hypothetical protein
LRSLLERQILPIHGAGSAGFRPCIYETTGSGAVGIAVFTIFAKLREIYDFYNF